MKKLSLPPVDAKTSRLELLIPFLRRHIRLLFAFAVTFLAFLCFFRLGNQPPQAWDEARHGVNAYEMLQRHNYVANYYNGEPDYWNLKPPVSYYAVMLGYRIFGYNAWGLRFFSALSYLVLTVCMMLYLNRNHSRTAGLLSVLLSGASFLYFFKHFVRSGDADALFILFFGIGILSLLLSDRNSNWLHLTGLMFSLAFLTKSYHAVILLPIGFFYLLFTHGFRKIRWWQYFTVIASALALILLWVWARYQFDGLKFLREMIGTDVLNRSQNAVEGHTGFPFFYTVALTAENPATALCIIATGWFVIRKIRARKKLTHLNILSLVSTVSILLIYTVCQTKLIWYIYPLGVPLILDGAASLTGLLRDTGLKCRARSALLWCSCAVILSGLCLSAAVTFRRGDDNELQNLLRSVPLTENAPVYYQDGDQTLIPQESLLVLEWTSGKQVSSGGFAAFIASGGAYLITDQNNASGSGCYTVIGESEHYVIWHKESIPRVST